MANLVEHTMLNGLEENLKSAIEMAGGEIPADACVWDYPGIIRDQLSSGGQVVKILPGKGIQVERDSKGNYVVSVVEANSAENVEINTIQAPAFSKGVEGGQWDKGTILQSFLDDLFSKVLPYVPSVKGGEIIIADEEGNDVFGYDEHTGKPLVTNGLDRYNQYIRLSLASQVEPVYISLENLKLEGGTVDLLKYYTKEETNNLLASSIENVIADINTKLQLHYYTKEDIDSLISRMGENVSKLEGELGDVKLNVASNYYTKEEVRDQVSNAKTDMSNYYTKSDVDNLMGKVEAELEDLEDDIKRAENELFDTKTSLASNYYTKVEVKDLIANSTPSTPSVDLSDYYTKSDVNNLVNNLDRNIDDVEDSVRDLERKVNSIEDSVRNLENAKSDYYTKSEVEDLIANSTPEIPEVDLSNYYTKEEIGALTDSINDSIDQVSGTATETKSKLESDYYTKTEVELLIAGGQGGEINLSNYYTKEETDNLVNAVGETATETKSKLESDYYTKAEVEDLIANSTPEIPEVDLSNYYTKPEIDAKLESKVVEVVEDKVTEVENVVTETTTKVETIETTVNNVETIVNNVETAVNTNTEKISELITEIETVKSGDIDAADYVDGLLLFDEIFGDSVQYQVSSKEELLSVINNTDNIVLNSNIELNNTPLIINHDVKIDLGEKELVGGVFTESNGNILEGSSDSFAFMVNPGTNLTITGNGVVKSQDATYSMAVWANGGTVVIKGGKFINNGDGCDLIYASNGGKVYIYDGEFIATGRSGEVGGTKNDHSALNIKDAHRDICEIVVYGGRFYKFNPGDNVSETEHTSFLAPGYKSVQDGDYFVVVKE